MLPGKPELGVSPEDNVRPRIRDSSEPEGAQSWFPGLRHTPLGEIWELLRSKRSCLHFPAYFANPWSLVVVQRLSF